MKHIRAKIIKLEERIKPRLEEKRKPIGIVLGVDPEDFLKKFDHIGRLGQLYKLPGVPVMWLRLSDEERLEAVNKTLYQTEHSKLELIQYDALIEILRIWDKLEKGNLESEMKQSTEYSEWFIVADFVREDKAYVYSTNDKSLILGWGYELVRKVEHPDSRIITCFEMYMGCRYDSSRESFYQLKNHNEHPQSYDTGLLERAFEFNRLRIVEYMQ